MNKIEITPKNKCLKFQEQPGSRSFSEDNTGKCRGKMIWLAGENWERYAPVPGDIHPCTEYRFMHCTKTNVERVTGRFVRIISDYEGIKNAPGMGGVRLLTAEQAIPTHPNYSKRPDSWARRDDFIFGQGPSPNQFGRITDENGAFKMFANNDPTQPQDGDPLSFRGQLPGVTSFLAQGAYQIDFRATSPTNWAANVHEGLGKVYDTIQSKVIHVPKVQDRNWLLTNCQSSIKKKSFDISITLLLSGIGKWHPWIYQKAPGGNLNLDQIAGL